MGWFRSNRRMGGGLALIALVIHFALSFGHLHVASVENATAAALTSSEPAAAASVPDAPAGPLTHPGLADPCAICANIHLAAASLLVEWPAWLLPLRAEQALPESSGVTKRPAWLGTAVQARAPPIT
jgi:hypothetical protein